MKKYKLSLGDECPIEKIKYALSLFKKLGYRSDVEWNRITFNEGNINRVNAYSHGDYRVHNGVFLSPPNTLFESITIPQLESLVTEHEQNKS